jgi:hypothetical protein
MRRNLSWIAPLLLLLSAAGRAEPPKPVGLPAGVTPLPPESAQHMRTLLEAAEKYRGLKAKAPIPAGTLEEAGLKKKLLESMGHRLSAETLRSAEISLKAFGLIPETMNLATYLPDLLTSQVAGYYDTERKYLAMVRRGGATVSPKEGPTEDDMVLVHELTHALQDQSFDLVRLEKEDDPLADSGDALAALAEGDATLTMLDFAARKHIERLPGASGVLESMLSDPSSLMDMAPDLPGAKDLEAAPTWLRDNLVFPYFQGTVFCLSVRARGGQKLLDYAFTTDPPRSTEQILHPEKWHTRRDDPVAIRLPDLAADLPGYRKAADGVMGELSVRSLLRDGLKEQIRAVEAATGWGGDHFAVYEKEGGGRLLVWVTDWDDEADVREFRTALAALGHGWQVEAAGPRRVVAIRGELGPEQQKKINARLAAAPVERPANRDLDLTAIGAKPDGPDKEAFQSLLKDHPEVKEKVDELVAKRAEKERAKRPAGQVSEDGRSYTNAAQGFSIRLPESLAGWTLNSGPAGSPMPVMITSPDHLVTVTLMHSPLASEDSPQEMGKMMELGLKGSMPGFHSLREGTVPTPAGDVRELWFEASPSGEKTRGVMRLLGRGADFYLLMAMGAEAAWPQHEKAAVEILNTFTLSTPEPAGKP